VFTGNLARVTLATIADALVPTLGEGARLSTPRVATVAALQQAGLVLFAPVSAAAPVAFGALFACTTAAGALIMIPISHFHRPLRE
jgi:hypothetical protein